MARTLTDPQIEFAKEVFSQLIASISSGRFKNQTDIGKAIGREMKLPALDQSRVSAVALNGKTSIQALLAAARLAGRTPEEIAKRTGLPMIAANDGLLTQRALALAELGVIYPWPKQLRASERAVTLHSVWEWLRHAQLDDSDGSLHDAIMRRLFSELETYPHGSAEAPPPLPMPALPAPASKAAASSGTPKRLKGRPTG
jgi:hypothetical protein